MSTARRATSWRPGRARLLLALAALAGGGCQRGTAPPSVEMIVDGGWRMIEMDPARLFEPSAVYARLGEPIARYDLPRDAASWSAANGSLRTTEEGLELIAGGPYPQWRRRVDIEASEACAVVIEALVPPGSSQLSWTVEGEAPSAVRSVTPFAWQGTAPTILTFVLGGHPGWTGRINLLRLDPGESPRSVLRRLTVHGCRAVEKKDLQVAVGRPWRVEIAADRRVAALLSSGSAHDWMVTVPPGGELRLATATVPIKASGASEARLRVDVSSGASVVSESFAARSSSWAEARLPLGWLAGRRVRLRFRTEGLGGEDLLAMAEPRLVARTSVPPSSPDVVLISLDTVRADHVSLYGHGQPTTPHIDAWARAHAVSFKEAFSAAGNTLPSHAVMLSGVDAHRGAIQADLNSLSPSVILLAQRFRQAGYRTVALTGGGYVHPELGFERGFDRFLWIPDDEAQGLAEKVKVAKAVLGEAEDRPLFVFFHTYAAHSPYNAYRVLLVARECQFKAAKLDITVRGDMPVLIWRPTSAESPLSLPPPERCLPSLYDEGLANLDRQLAPLLARVSRADRKRVVLLTSDHGEALGEAGRVSHGWPHVAIAAVPLMVAAPGLPAGTWSDVEACGADIAPTLLSLAGLPMPRGLNGRSLFPPSARATPCLYYAAAPKPSVVRFDPGGQALVVDMEDGRTWAYDRRSDPDALAPLTVEVPDTGRPGVETILAEFRAATKPPADPRRPSAELAETLRALGYIQ